MSRIASDKSSTRDTILDAATELLAQDQANPSLEAIARKAGVSRQSIYLHFGSRTGLLLALVQRIDETEAHLEDHVKRLASAPSALDALEIALEAPPTYYPLVYPIAKVFMRERLLDEEVAAAWQDRMDARLQICELLAGRLEAEGLLADPWTVRSAAETLWVTTSWEVWERFVVDLGWPSERYGAILRRTAYRVLLRADAS